MITTSDYLKKQEKANFKEGEKVEITRAAESKEQGWPNSWIPEMNNYVGKVGVVTTIFEHGIRVKVAEHEWSYPFFVLKRYSLPEPTKIVF